MESENSNDLLVSSSREQQRIIKAELQENSDLNAGERYQEPSDDIISNGYSEKASSFSVEMETDMAVLGIEVIPTSFACQQCDTHLNTLEEFMKHMNTVHLHNSSNEIDVDKGDESICSICDLRFTNKMEIKAHFNDHFMTSWAKWKCQKCKNKSFGSHQELKEHFFSNHIHTIFRCTICLELFTERDLLTEHLFIHTKREQKFGCVRCQLEYDSHLLFEKHVQEVHQKKALKRSTSKDALSIQKKNKLVKRESSKGMELQKIETAILQPQQQPRTIVTRRDLKCIVCDAEYPDELSLDQHRLFEHCKVQKMDHCTICRGVLINLDEFLEHTRNHNPIGEIHCIICRQSIRGEIQLRMHGEYHLDIKNNQFGKSSEEFLIECSTCKMKVTDDEYTKHLLLHVVNDLEVTGNSNEMVAESSNISNKGRKIDSEIKIMEEDELLMKCSECGKALDSMDQLNLHTLEHLSELINSSNINQKLALRVEDGGKNKQHQTSGSKRTAHRKQTNRALICQICDKCFSSQAALTIHGQIHTTSLCQKEK